MPTVTIAIPDDLSAQLEPYRNTLAEVLRIGLQEVKKAQGLALYKQGHLSLWKAARLAGVPLREMPQYAVAQGLRASAAVAALRQARESHRGAWRMSMVLETTRVDNG